MPYFTDFGTLQCLILQISELSHALFYRHRERLASGRCKQRSGNPEPRERSGNALFCILRLFVESVDDVGHDVAGQRVAIGLGAALRVEDLGDVAEVAEDVEGIEGEGEAGLGEGLAEAGVPYEVVGIGRAAGISAARVHGEVGGYFKVAGQLDCGGQSVVEVTEGKGIEAFTRGGDMADAEVTLGTDRVLAELVVESECLCTPPRVDAAAHRGYGRILADIVNAVVKLGMGNGVEGKAFALVKWAAVVDIGSEQVVAVYVLRPVVAYARGAVVGVGVGYGIDSGVVCQAGGKVRLFLRVIGLIQ